MYTQQLFSRSGALCMATVISITNVMYAANTQEQLVADQTAEITPSMNYTFAYPSKKAPNKGLNDSVVSGRFDRGIRIQINVEDIHLYGILGGMQHTLKDMLDDATMQPNDDQIANEITTLRYVYDTIDLERITLASIIHDINSNNFLPKLEFEGAFLNICNSLRRVKRLEPRHLRELSSSIQQFNSMLMNYYFNRKSFLSAREITAFNKLISFNTVLVEQLLVADYFDFTTGDYLIDTIYYRPKAFILQNKAAVAISCIVLVAGAVAWYYYTRPANSSNNWDINDLSCARQKGRTCGLHALLNGVVFQGAPGDIAAKEKALPSYEDIIALRNRLAPVFAKHKEHAVIINAAAANQASEKLPDGSNLEHSTLGALLVSPEFFNVVRDYYNEVKKIPLSNVAGDIAVVVDPKLYSAEKMLNGCSNVVQALDETVLPSINNFRDGKKPQTVLCYHGPLEYDADGHWSMAHLVHDNRAVQGVRIYAADSNGSSGKNNQAIENLAHLYKDAPVMTQLEFRSVLEAISSTNILNQTFDDAKNAVVEILLKAEGNPAPTGEQKAARLASNSAAIAAAMPKVQLERAFSSFIRSLLGLIEKKDDAYFASQNNLVVNEMHARFKQLVTYWDANSKDSNLVNINLPTGASIKLDYYKLTNFSEFVTWLRTAAK
jgi:hypothetical protein